MKQFTAGSAYSCLSAWPGFLLLPSVSRDTVQCLLPLSDSLSLACTYAYPNVDMFLCLCVLFTLTKTAFKNIVGQSKIWELQGVL